MYTLTEQQIDFILSDIKSRGVKMEELQSDLLDHICCVIECELQPDGDFESFYRKTIPRFFKKELREIEEETILLLTFKHYYAMRKTMIITGTVSVVLMIFGSFFKLMHWPGANLMLMLGVTLASLVFMPLLFIFRTKEGNSSRDKIVLGAGVVFGILVSLSTLFKVLHWPGGNIMWFVSLGILFFVYIPVYFFTGIRNPETKLNTITSTVLLMLAGGLLFVLTNVRPSKVIRMNSMYALIQGEELLKQMQDNVNDSVAAHELYAEINSDCRKIKELILKNEIGQTAIPRNFEEQGIFISEGSMDNSFYGDGDGEGVKLFNRLKEAVMKYNTSGSKKIPVEYSVLDVEAEKIGLFSNLSVLNGMTQIQMFLASAEK